MIVAFPIDSDKGLDSEISEHFGRARYFLLARLEDGKLEGVDIVPAPAHAFGAFPQFLHDLDVRVVVCNSIGNKAMEMFDNQGIIVFSNNSGKVSKALQELLPKIKEIEEKDREEEEKREKARKALEKARERTMNFYLDLGNDPNEVFVSIKLKDDLYLSLDLTRTGPRIVLQRFLGEVDTGDLGEPLDTYKTLHFLGTRLVKVEDQRWWRKNDRDIVEGTLWEDVLELEMDSEVEGKVREFAKLVRENLDSIDKLKEDVKNFNLFLYDIVRNIKERPELGEVEL